MILARGKPEPQTHVWVRGQFHVAVDPRGEDGALAPVVALREPASQDGFRDTLALFSTVSIGGGDEIDPNSSARS